MDTVFSEHFAHLHRQAERQVGQLSAVCEMLDLVAIELGGDTNQLLTKLFEIILRHLGTDSLYFKAKIPKWERNISLPLHLHACAAGIPPLNHDESQQIDRLINNQPDYPMSAQTYNLGKQTLAIIPLEAGEYRAGFLAILHHDIAFFTPEQFRFFRLLANELTSILRLLEKQQQLIEETRDKERLCRFFSPEISREILATAGQQCRGKESLATILFADIRGFSHLTEILKPHQIIEILNHFYQTMTRIIFKHLGTLDKFVGDGLLALFGAPVSREDDPFRAVKAAIEMQQEWQKRFSIASEDNLAVNIQPAFAVGIHTGKVISGFLGNDELLTFTVIGDAVNTCHRIVSLAEARQIIISGETKVTMDQQDNNTSSLSAAIVPYRSAQALRGMDKVIDLYQVEKYGS
ncbi:MAG: adenylate/guanylate cyclase domain-containing protein [Deltaproteobacteria bacterium]|nr:adenylate/guanylate cyclase domain-containing protein [Deltaproteobacteria bacterium]